MKEEGPAIRAGINITPTADEFADDRLGDVQTLRDNYRDAVLDYQGISEAFGALIEKYGEKELPPAIRYLLKSLSADISSDGASIDKRKLNLILNDMYRLEVLASLLEQCTELVTKTNECVGSAIPATDLLKDVLKFQEDKWIRPEQISPLPSKLCIEEVPREINFLREFKEFIRLIPLKAYNDPEQRSRFLDAAQQALEEAIEREEEE